MDNEEVEAEPAAEEEAQEPVVVVTTSSCPWRDGLARTCWLAFYLFLSDEAFYLFSAGASVASRRNLHDVLSYFLRESTWPICVGSGKNIRTVR